MHNEHITDLFLWWLWALFPQFLVLPNLALVLVSSRVSPPHAIEAPILRVGVEPHVCLYMCTYTYMC